MLAAGKDYEKALHAVMTTKGPLGEEDVDVVLKKAGLDPQSLLATFKKDQDRIDGILARNMDQANAFGFGGTPAFLVNTRIHHGAMDRQALRDAIAAARS